MHRTAAVDEGAARAAPGPGHGALRVRQRDRADRDPVVQVDRFDAHPRVAHQTEQGSCRAVAIAFHGIERGAIHEDHAHLRGTEHLGKRREARERGAHDHERVHAADAHGSDRRRDRA